MKNKNESIFMSLIQVAFIVLKLCKVIDWSWWWVLSPIWIPSGLIIIALLIGLIRAIIDYLRGK